MIICSVFKSLQEQLNEWADDAEGLQCDACRELQSIRATLLVNFGKDAKNNRWGTTLEDAGSTEKLLLEVLEHLCKANQ